MKENEITRAVIGAAIEVHRILGINSLRTIPSGIPLRSSHSTSVPLRFILRIAMVSAIFQRRGAEEK